MKCKYNLIFQIFITCTWISNTKLTPISHFHSTFDGVFKMIQNKTSLFITFGFDFQAKT